MHKTVSNNNNNKKTRQELRIQGNSSLGLNICTLYWNSLQCCVFFISNFLFVFFFSIDRGFLSTEELLKWEIMLKISSLTTSCEPRRSHLKKQNSVKISQLIPIMSTEVNNRLKTTSLIKNSCLLSQFRLPSKWQIQCELFLVGALLLKWIFFYPF